MLNSEERILVTHAGSLPRSEALTDLLLRQQAGEPTDEVALTREAATAVRSVVGHQIDAGVDVISDGEQPRVSFLTYVTQRMQGFGGVSQRNTPQDHDDFPDFVRLRRARFPPRARTHNAPQAIAELSYTDLQPAQMECALFASSLAGLPIAPAETFMTAASPGTIATLMLNAFYDTHEQYVFAIAREMRREYELIASQGFLLQLDAPDLALERSMMFKDRSLGEFLATVEIHVAAINEAIATIPRDRLRLHCCWGNWEGPHTHDVPLREILPLLYRAKVGALSIEFANPRHQHEYAALGEFPLPGEMVLIPGVIDSTTNFVEHPQVVANRICEAVAAVGDRTRVIAGTDCGFGTFAGYSHVATDVVWAKLRSLREGADLATQRLW